MRQTFGSAQILRTYSSDSLAQNQPLASHFGNDPELPTIRKLNLLCLMISPQAIMSHLLLGPKRSTALRPSNSPKRGLNGSETVRCNYTVAKTKKGLRPKPQAPT